MLLLCVYVGGTVAVHMCWCMTRLLVYEYYEYCIQLTVQRENHVYRKDFGFKTRWDCILSVGLHPLPLYVVPLYNARPPSVSALSRDFCTLFL